MDDRHRTILQKGRVHLVKNLCDIEGICDRLYGYGVLTASMKSEILNEASAEQQARMLLDIIPKRGRQAYDFLHQTLVETSQQSLADILKPELARNPFSKAKSVEETPHRYDSSSMQRCATIGSPVTEVISPFPGLIESSPDVPFTPENIKPMSVKLQKCNREALKLTPETYYQMNSSGNNRGKLILVNILDFEDKASLPSRDKQAHDLSASSISLLFHKLNFTVDIKTNIDKNALLSIITAEQNNLVTYDCFVMVILTHGTGDLIFMKDGEPLKIENIIEQFDSNYCPKLKGKPKLFFIHACPSDSSLPEDVQLASILPSLKEPGHHLTKADIFVTKATTYDPIVYNEESKGFRFIQAFVHVMKQNAHKKHLLEMMTIVNRLAEEDNQLADIHHTLRKDLYFFPE